MSRRKRFPVLALIIVILGCLMVLVPVYWMIITSFKEAPETFSNPPTLWPTKFTLDAYKKVMDVYSFGSFFGNSLVVVVLSTLLTILVSTMAGFGASRFKFKGKGAFLGFVLVPIGNHAYPVLQDTEAVWPYKYAPWPDYRIYILPGTALHMAYVQLFRDNPEGS